MITTHIHNPHHEPAGETFAVVVRTATGEVKVPCWTLAEANDIRDSVFDVGLSCRVLGLPTVIGFAGFFEDGADRAALPDIAD